MYSSYEEYMQNVLGMNMQNTYRDNGNYYYDMQRVNPNMNMPNIQTLNQFYPEIYSVIYPMVQKACSRRNMERDNGRTNFSNG